MNTSKVSPPLSQASDLSFWAQNVQQPDLPALTAPDAGRQLGVAYWQAAVSTYNIPPSHIRLHMGADAAQAHHALSIGFHVAFDAQHPAYERLVSLANSLNLSCVTTHLSNKNDPQLVERDR